MHWLETGNAASLDTYVRIGAALALRLEAELVDPRRRDRPPRLSDPVHAAIVDLLAARLRGRGATVAVDEPFQDYHFAGRADVLAWRIDWAALLHVEVKTQLLDIQETVGRYNEKRRFLPRQVAANVGLRNGWRTVTNVLCGLWSAEVIHPLRLRWSTFSAVCPDAEAGLESWLAGTPPTDDTSSVVLIDPSIEGRVTRRWYLGRERVGLVRPRYRDYADAVATLRQKGAA